MTDIKIYFKKGQLSLFLLVLLFFIPINLALFVTPNLVFKGIALLLFILIAGMLGLILRRLLSFKPALVIGPRGLTDRTNHLKNPLIAWENIDDLELANSGSQALILIKLTEPEAFLRREAGRWQSVHQSSFELYGTPETIALSPLQINGDRLFNLLKENFTKYGKTTQTRR